MTSLMVSNLLYCWVFSEAEWPHIYFCPLGTPGLWVIHEVLTNKAITAPDIFSRGKLLPMELNSIILQDHCNIFAILFEHLILSTCRVVAVMVINGHLGRDNRKAHQQTKAVKNTRISRINRS